MTNERDERDVTYEPGAVKSSRMKLLALIAIAFVPIFIAYISYFMLPMLAPEGKTNQGELILPVVQATDIAAELGTIDSWALIQPVGADCDEDCRQMMYLSRQVVSGLGKDSSRVSRVLLIREPLADSLDSHVAQEHGDALIVQSMADVLNAVTDLEPVLFLMDPNGNIMMYFSFEKAGKPMLKDLKHLLRVSNIG